MKALALCLAAMFGFTSLACAGYVSGYMRKDGTYVNGYYRSESNSTVRDNYDYKGNVNPYTGEKGTNFYRDSQSSEYYQPKYYKNIFDNND